MKTVCCDGCGRDVKVTNKAFAAAPNKLRYCHRCSKSGFSSYAAGDNRKDHSAENFQDATLEDDYSEESNP